MNKIVYRFREQYEQEKEIIYVNIIPRYSCINRCLFCHRQDKKDNIYEDQVGYPLWLDRRPSPGEVVGALSSVITSSTEEIAFVGMGEPMLHFETLLGSIKSVCRRYPRSSFPYRMRINTNGLIYFLSGRERQVDLLEEAGLDEIRISLNAVDSDDYKKLCRPPQKESRDAFWDAINFVNDCNMSRIKTMVSFVTDYRSDTASSRNPLEYEEFCRSIGIDVSQIIMRKYVTNEINK